MNNKVLEEIKNFAIKRLKEEYGYCGAAEGDNMAMLNSGNDGENLIIKFEDRKD